MKRILQASTVILGLIALPCVISAQTAKQGGTEALASNSFHSPMVVDTVLAATDRSSWGKGEWFSAPDYHRLGRFTCDGLSIRSSYNARKGSWQPGLQMAVRPLNAGMAQIKLRMSIHNPEENHDKLVRLVLEIAQGPTILQTVAPEPFEVEASGDSTEAHMKFTVPLEILDGTPKPTLRITMTAEDD